jgi:Protein of unknown function (DUF3105)
MSSRKEEKERLRREREEAERAAMASESRRRRIAAALGGALLVAIAVVVVLAVVGGGGDDGPGGNGPDGPAALPAKQTDDLQEAARAAGCTIEEPKDEGNAHLPNQEATYDEYKSNPPTSGPHRPPPAAQDGIYLPGRSPAKENWVHTLEHGRVIFMYAPGTPERRRQQLETLMNEDVGEQPSGYKSVVMENNTNMPFAVAGVAWGAYVGCRTFNDRVFDALRAFRLEHIANPKAPEAEFPWPAE